MNYSTALKEAGERLATAHVQDTVQADCRGGMYEALCRKDYLAGYEKLAGELVKMHGALSALLLFTEAESRNVWQVYDCGKGSFDEYFSAIAQVITAREALASFERSLAGGGA